MIMAIYGGRAIYATGDRSVNTYLSGFNPILLSWRSNSARNLG